MNGAEPVQSDLALTPVSEIMRETVLKVTPATPVTEIFSWFRKRGHTHLIVTDAQGSVLGVITSFDLLSAISQTIGMGRAPSEFIPPEPALQSFGTPASTMPG